MLGSPLFPKPSAYKAVTETCQVSALEHGPERQRPYARAVAGLQRQGQP
jgi:hypothetical protein